MFGFILSEISRMWHLVRLNQFNWLTGFIKDSSSKEVMLEDGLEDVKNLMDQGKFKENEDLMDNNDLEDI